MTRSGGLPRGWLEAKAGLVLPWACLGSSDARVAEGPQHLGEPSSTARRSNHHGHHHDTPISPPSNLTYSLLSSIIGSYTTMTQLATVLVLAEGGTRPHFGFSDDP